MKTSRTPRLSTLCVAAVAALALAACGAEGEAERQETSGAGSPEHNEADVRFASEMIPHHAQALMMTDLAIGRELDEEVSMLVEDIRAAQAPEIEVMVDWLQEWGEPVPATVRDHAHGGHEGDGGTEMPEMDGMMTDEQLSELETAGPADFEQLWLTMMIEHHEGAVEMAESELDEGRYQPALEMAEEIASSQSEEIEQMQGMLEE